MMLARLGNVFTDAKRLLIGAAVVVAVSILLANVALRFLPQRAKPPSVVIGLHLPAGRNRTAAAPASDAKPPLPPQVGEDRRAPAIAGPAAANPARPARGRLRPRTTPAKHFSFGFERPLHHRQSRAVAHGLLFMNTNHDEGIGITDGKPWCEGILNTNHQCFGYYARGVAYYPSPATMQACSFSKDSDWDVPLMIRTQFPLKAQESYKNYLNENKKTNIFYCAGDPEQPKCKIGDCKDGLGKKSGAKVYGWPCMHNYCINRLAFNVVHFDFRMYKSNQTNPERGQMLKYLRRECRFRQDSINPKQPIWRSRAVETYVAVFAKYARCLMREDGWEYYCPNPCKNPAACSGENMLSICHPVESDNNKYQMLIDVEYFEHLKPIFKYVKHCECITGYFYSMETETCEPKDIACLNARDCLHNGRCEPVRDLAVREIIGRNFNCRCPPAWQGLRCEEAKDPCRIPVNRKSCGEFQCRRSPADDEIGFTCLCPPGYSLTRQNVLTRKDRDNKETSRRVPSCRDINECAVTAPCRNGGNCVNTVGSFKCSCVRGFSGQLCEVPPLPPHWLEWEEWSACSVTCSGGVQNRMRNCSITGSCLGSRTAFKTCVGRFLECSDEALVGIDPMTLAGGAGWREEEDAILDDAWYFMEYQELRLGMNKLTAAEEELLIGMEEGLPILIPYSVVLLLLEFIILLVVFWRIRLHRPG